MQLNDFIKINIGKDRDQPEISVKEIKFLTENELSRIRTDITNL